MVKTGPKVSPRSPSGVKWEQVKNDVDDNDNDDDYYYYDDGDDDNGGGGEDILQNSSHAYLDELTAVFCLVIFKSKLLEARYNPFTSIIDKIT